MTKTLAELRQSPRSSLPEQTYELCLSQSLVAEAQALQMRKDALEVEAKRQTDDGEPIGPPLRVGEGPDHDGIAEIDARLKALWSEMREHTGMVRIRAITAGEWRRWADANPPREDGRNEHGRPVVRAVDEEVAFGRVNASALLARLGDFVVSWNDEPLRNGDWEWLRENAPPGDLKAMARVVVELHEAPGAKPAPFWPTDSSATLNGSSG